jgi:hypothetical protein
MNYRNVIKIVNAVFVKIENFLGPITRAPIFEVTT